MGLLHNRTLTPKQRAKIEQQLERDQQFRECAQLEYGKKNPAFSGVVAEIVAVLRDLAAIYVAEGRTKWRPTPSGFSLFNFEILRANPRCSLRYPKILFQQHLPNRDIRSMCPRDAPSQFAECLV
jgi:hypothetical protein